ADLGRLRGFNVRHGVSALLVCWFASRSRDFARPREEQDPTGYLRHPVHGLARFGASLAPLPIGLFVASWSGYALGAFRAHGGELRLRHRDCSWLAHHHFPALLRGRSHLFRIRYGADAGDSSPQSLW